MMHKKLFPLLLCMALFSWQQKAICGPYDKYSNIVPGLYLLAEVGPYACAAAAHFLPIEHPLSDEQQWYINAATTAAGAKFAVDAIRVLAWRLEILGKHEGGIG